MRQRPYLQVDVFTPEPYRGNPLAVVLDGEGLTAEAMQQFTDWTHLSEATFVLPPTPEGRAAGADYRVRIFSPGRELPFAGHPTLGSCHAWLQSGGQPRVAGRVVQECGVGLVALRQDDDRLAFAAPPLIKSGPLDEADVARIAQGLGVARSDILHHAWCDNGPNWRGVMLRSAAQVLALKPDGAILAGLDVGVVGQPLKAARPRRVARSAWWAAAMRTASPSKCAPSSPATTAWRKTPSRAASMPRWRNGLLARASRPRATWPARAPRWGAPGGCM